MQKVLIVYWTSTGNTEAMAKAIARGCEENAEVTCANVSEAPSIDGYDKYLFGCSSMGDEVLDEGEFEPYFASIENALSGKKVALFGSYGWGDGQWMRDWEERVKADGMDLYDKGLIVNETPTADDEALCLDFAKAFMAF